ncbi:MAG: SDR family NAD(P)-dependent oxidoreductase [Pedobacter sp.]|nr:MAG: SDR family NAD(P)-dependent oxidoreductase [Pedobacter sp.]
MGKNNYQGVLQNPIGSNFSAASTTNDVIKGIDLKGKTAIVTGGYAGIGLETVKALVLAGSNVIVPTRNIEKAKKSLAGIANVELEIMDLMNPNSIDAFSEKFLSSNRPLHLLINNAGIMWVPLQRDERGYESQISTNYLGHFQLTAKLWSALVKANGARVVNVSSWGHHFSPFVFDDPNFNKREFESFSAYGQSKTASILFALELDNRGKDFGVRSYSLHPGIISESELGRNVPHEDLVSYGVFDENGKVINDPSKGLKSLTQGASTTVWCATSPQLDDIGGVYCENADIAQLENVEVDGSKENMDGTTMMKDVMPYALDETSAKKLWKLSESLTDTKFEI